MTFRQILNILWQRRLFIVATVVLAVVVAGVYLRTQTPTYSSTATARLSALGTAAADSGQIGSAQVDFNIESITSPTVLEDAAKRSGDASGSSLDGRITYTTQEATSSTPTTRLTVTVTGPTASSAESRANAVVAAYNAYLQTQQNKALAAAKVQLVQQTADAESYQSQVTADSNDAIAQSNLTSTLANITTINATIAQITSSGPPLTVLAAAGPGAAQGVTAKTALLIAFVAGLIAGIGAALIRDQFDNRLRGEQEITPLTGAPSLGELSLDRRVARRKERLPAADRKHTALNEGLRGLRKTLQVLLPTTHALVVFTSVEPGDGKTFLSANLALVWARTGKKVILVGGDLRRPRLGDYYPDAADGAGLADLLSAASESGAPSDAEIETCLRPSEFEGLRVLPSGAEPHNPADLLANDALGSIFTSLRAMSDIVVVDSPPSLAIVDATLLASSADGAVVVASIGRTNRGSLTETVRTLKSNSVPVLGVIANRSRRRLPASYGAYYGTDGTARGPLHGARVRERSGDFPGDSETTAAAPEGSNGATTVAPDEQNQRSASGSDVA